MSVLLVLLITLAVGYLAYRIIADGFRRPQSERLGCFGIFGYFVLIVLGVWLATLVAHRCRHVAAGVDRVGPGRPPRLVGGSRSASIVL
jgi:hypothetical protein